MDTKKLRQKILDLAIHGKLVPQDPNDEPASVLLERIRAEKERLIAEGKIKRSKKATTSDTPHYENVPFEVPENWIWIDLNSICSKIVDGDHNPPSGEDSPTKYRMLSSKNINCNTIVNIDDCRYLSEHDWKICHSRTRLNKGDVLLTTVATLGRSCVVETDEPICFQRSVTILTTLIYNKYLKYVFDSNYYQELMTDTAKGTAQKGFYINQVVDSIIPLPPLAEQMRIVHAVSQWTSFIDSIESCTADLLQSIQSAKSKILDLAIHGKLVPQDPNDEPASELLKRINPKAVSSCDNPHYGILPENWCWVKLGQLFNIVSAKRVTKEQWKSVGVPFYRTREIVQLSQNGHVDNDLFIDTEHYETLKNKYGIPQPGDIMLTAVGTIGKTYVVSQDDKFYYKDASVLCMRNVHNINSQYITLAFCSTLVQKQLYEKSKGTTVDTITIEKANNYIFPIPPIEEQHRIVLKVNELFSQLDLIEKSLQA